MISAQNLIGLIGGIVLVIYLFFALTHPDKF
jgi:K+-transporting ATPase KdpF subunit